LLLGIDEYKKDLNLTISTKEDKPGDYYLRIANDYKNSLLKKDDKKSQIILETLNKIDLKTQRKFFKRIIMTINYGLTRYGMLFNFYRENIDLKLNIEKEIIKCIRDSFYSFIQGITLYKSLDKIVEIANILLSLNKILIFKSTLFGLSDLKENETEIYSSTAYYQGRNVVLRPNITNKTKQKKTRPSMTLLIQNHNVIDKQQFIRAFKANFIHHLDSICVYSFVFFCIDKLKNLAVIHDCYSTDLNSVDNLNCYFRDILKDIFKEENSLLLFLGSVLKEFVNLNKQEYIDLLNDLRVDKDKHNALIKELKDSFYLLFP
jgi:DNA-directed RNA polymerase